MWGPTQLTLATTMCHAPERVGAPGRGRQRQAPGCGGGPVARPRDLGEKGCGCHPGSGETLEGSAPKRKVSFHTVSARTAWSGSALGRKGVLCAICCCGPLSHQHGMDFCAQRQGYPAIRPCPSSAQVVGLLRRLVSAAPLFFPQPPSQCWRQAHNRGCLPSNLSLFLTGGEGSSANNQSASQQRVCRCAHAPTAGGGATS